MLGPIKRSTGWALLKRVVSRFGDLNLGDRAGGLTYWGLLSLFPALIVAVSVLAVVGTYPETYERIMETVREVAPGGVAQTIDSSLQEVLRSSRGSGVLLLAGLVGALWAGSGATGGAIRALNEVHRVEQSRPFWQAALVRVALTLAIMLLLAVAFTSLIIAGPIFAAIADAAGIGESAKTLIGTLRWPVGLLTLVSALVLLYWIAPAIPRRPLRKVLPGAAVATLIWVLASAGFSIYVGNFGNYDATYGSLGTVIVLLVWMWLGSLAMLLGDVVNVELEQVREDKPAEGPPTLPA